MSECKCWSEHRPVKLYKVGNGYVWALCRKCDHLFKMQDTDARYEEFQKHQPDSIEENH